ncbi:MmcQ/YjbR family DNA-binding protein [Shewanella surugensis]|uniref:MmcQ/YjbR family DNA-binding protein n=1 Tax=Shewanella surugensis TaxID=212020 RepID=A0ABT0LHS2_9GAMM|nr:MmcQ/YjbR family DNA-binding protein [Shewanella surugensis]MCL1127249.1 MmcQ/YjbR family DNA-binding protein [Shewanella surugensis]
MTHDEFNHFCGSLPATTYVMQWNHSHVWKVGGKVFAIGNLGKSNQATYTFKVSEQNFVFLTEHSGYQPAPYFASRGMKWIQQIDSTKDTFEALTYYLTQSHHIVSLGLTKIKQKQLGLDLG